MENLTKKCYKTILLVIWLEKAERSEAKNAKRSFASKLSQIENIFSFASLSDILQNKNKQMIFLAVVFTFL